MIGFKVDRSNSSEEDASVVLKPVEEKSVEEKSVESQDQKTLNHLCKVSHHTIPMLVKLASKGRSDAIREAAFHTLSCLLHMASKTVLTKFSMTTKLCPPHPTFLLVLFARAYSPIPRIFLSEMT